MRVRSLCPLIGVVTGCIFIGIPQTGRAEVRHITLSEAVHLAITQNHALKIARIKTQEYQEKKAGEHSSYFPTLSNQSNALHITQLQNIVIPAGGLGVVGGSFIPPHELSLDQGKQNLYSSGTMLAQPITQ